MYYQMSRDYRAGCSTGQGKGVDEGLQSEFRFQDDRDGQGKEPKSKWSQVVYPNEPKHVRLRKALAGPEG